MTAVMVLLMLITMLVMMLVMMLMMMIITIMIASEWMLMPLLLKRIKTDEDCGRKPVHRCALPMQRILCTPMQRKQVEHPCCECVLSTLYFGWKPLSSL